MASQEGSVMLENLHLTKVACLHEFEFSQLNPE
jgi:hypothetical protein